MRIKSAALLGMSALAFLSIGAQAPTGFLPVTATRILDATGLPANGTLTAQILVKGQPVGVSAGGGGKITSATVTANIVNGAFSINLPDTSLTNPANVCVALSAVDDVSGGQLLGPNLNCVQPTSVPNYWCTANLCNFDLYTPNTAAVAPVTVGAKGDKGDTGAAAVVTSNGTNGNWGIPGAAIVGSIVYGPRNDQNIVTAGDSTTAGAGLTTAQTWPYQLSQLPFFRNRANLYNAAVSGDTCAQMTSRYASNVQPHKPAGSITTSFLTVMIGRNNLSDTPSSVESCIDSYITQAKADGFTVVLMTILPSAIPASAFPGMGSYGYDPITATQDLNRQEINQYIRADTLADYTFDTAALLAKPWDARWTLDGTHPTARMATLIARNLNIFMANGGPLGTGVPQDGQSPVFLGNVQVGNGAGGKFVAAGNISQSKLDSGDAGYGLPGIHMGFNCALPGNTVYYGCVIAAGLSGQVEGLDFYGENADGSFMHMLKLDPEGTLAGMILFGNFLAQGVVNTQSGYQINNTAGYTGPASGAQFCHGLAIAAGATCTP